MPSLTPPIEHRKALLTLAQMKDDDYETLRTVLGRNDLSDGPDSEAAGGKSLDLSELDLSEDVKPVLGVIKTIYAMHSVKAKYSMNVDEFVKSVMNGVEDTKNPVFSSSEFKSAGDRLKELLSLDGSISRRSKVRSVINEHGMVFCDCRVLTDVRPVFGDDPEQEPTEMVIVHTIKLAYHEVGKHREIFISADPSDIKSLREALDRAEKKATTLGNLLKSKDINISGMGT